MDSQTNQYINHNTPLMMHVDLNSAFATAEQQAYPHLRGKPIVVVAYDSPNGCVIAPSIESKRLGIKTGMNLRDARMICRDVIVRKSDPPKYRYIHLQLREIFKDYSPNMYPKSIDEVLIDFTGTPALRSKNMVEIGKEIKMRVREEIGEWISCNVGIGTNQFLAKTAASLHKPDGLDIITFNNILKVYECLNLIDLCGINVHYQARLNAAGIYTPMEFFNAPAYKLKHEVFKSILGIYWYQKLRGWESDKFEYARKSYGQSYALKYYSNDPKELSRLLLKLTEKMGRRLRRAGYSAKGVYVGCVYSDRTWWHIGRTHDVAYYSTSDLFLKAQYLLNMQPEWKKATHIFVSCYDLENGGREQLSIFENEQTKKRELSSALDEINDRYGEFTVVPALMMGMDQTILDRVPFGGVKDLEDIYLN